MQIEKIGKSYLIGGSEKAALIDLPTEFDEKIINADIVIINHVDPSMRECLIKLIRIKPNVLIYSSAAGQKFLEELLNVEFCGCVCKHKRSVDLGGVSLSFYITPNLTWPDTIMTYASCGVLFTGDFLSWCDDEFGSKFGGMYEYALSATDVINAINPQKIYTSGGEISQQRLSDVFTLCQKKCSEKSVIAYYSHYGFTEKLAKELKNHLLNAELFNLSECNTSAAADAASNAAVVYLGTNTENGNLPKPVWDFLSYLDTRRVKNKPYLVFGSGGWSHDGAYIADGILQRLKMRRLDRPCTAVLYPSEKEIKKLLCVSDKINEED